MNSKMSLLARFSADQVRRIVMVGNQPKYLKSFDRVIEDIFDYHKLGTKFASSRTQTELMFVLDSFGVDSTRILRDSQLYGALEDLVRMDYDLRKLKRQMEDDKRKRGKVAKGDIKLYDRIAKLYRRTIKAVCGELNIKRRRNAAFQRNYQGAREFIRRREDRDFFGGFGVWDEDGVFYPEEEGAWFSNSGTDYFEEFVRGMNSRGHGNVDMGARPRYDMNSVMSELEDDDDDSFDTIGRRVWRDDSIPARSAASWALEQSDAARRKVSLIDAIGSRGSTTPYRRARTGEQAQYTSAPASETNALLEKLVKKIDTSNDLLVMLTQQQVRQPTYVAANEMGRHPGEFSTPSGRLFKRVDVIQETQAIPQDVDVPDEVEEAELDREFEHQNFSDGVTAEGATAKTNTSGLDRASLIGLVNGVRAGAPDTEQAEQPIEEAAPDTVPDETPAVTAESRPES